MGFTNLFFFICAFVAVAGAVMVVVSKQLMHACVFLLASLLGVAGLYVTLSADFVAATQLVVYIGGVVILMLFAVMLTNGTQSNEPNKFGLSKVPGMGDKKTFAVAGFFTLISAMIIGRIIYKMTGSVEAVEDLKFTTTVEELGTLLVTDHILAFEFSSILLLGALIGAAIIARPRKGQ